MTTATHLAEARQLARHANLIGADKQVRRFREEDARNGIIWNDTREAGAPNKQPVSNS